MTYASDHPAPCTILLITGDRDFAYAVSVLRLRGHPVVLISPTSPTPHTSITAQAVVCLEWNKDIMDLIGTVTASAPTVPSDVSQGHSSSKYGGANVFPPGVTYGGSPKKEAYPTLDHSPVPEGLEPVAKPTVQLQGNDWPGPRAERHSSKILLNYNISVEAEIDKGVAAGLKAHKIRRNLLSSTDHTEPVTSLPNAKKSPRHYISPEPVEIVEMGGPVALQCIPGQGQLKRSVHSAEELSIPPCVPKGMQRAPCGEIKQLEKGLGSTHLGKINSGIVGASTKPQARVPAPLVSEGTQADISGGKATPAVLEEPVIPAHFRLLALHLEAYRLKGIRKPLRSAVAGEMVGVAKTLYLQAGVTSFKKYSEMASYQGFIILGGLSGTAWISLHPNWHGRVC